MAYSLGSALISWGTKRQNSVALSTAKVEYVDVSACCAQFLWIKQQLKDFGVIKETIPLLYDNISEMNMAKNLVQTKK